MIRIVKKFKTFVSPRNLGLSLGEGVKIALGRNLNFFFPREQSFL
jgi:hypothetical protein